MGHIYFVANFSHYKLPVPTTDLHQLPARTVHTGHSLFGTKLTYISTEKKTQRKMKVTSAIRISSFLVAFCVILPSCSGYPPYYYTYPNQVQATPPVPTPLYGSAPFTPTAPLTPLVQYPWYPYYTNAQSNSNPSAKPAASSTSNDKQDSSQKPTTSYQEVFQRFVMRSRGTGDN